MEPVVPALLRAPVLLPLTARAANFGREAAAALLAGAVAGSERGGAGAAAALHDDAGWTPAHLAARADAVAVVRLLRQCGHDMNAGRAEAAAGRGAAAPGPCRDGWTPLHCAVAAGAVAVVEVLLGELGADPHRRGGAGLSAYELLALLAPPGGKAVERAGGGGGGQRPLDEERALRMTEAFLHVLHGPQEQSRGAAGPASGADSDSGAGASLAFTTTGAGEWVSEVSGSWGDVLRRFEGAGGRVVKTAS